MSRRVFVIGGGNFGTQLAKRLAELGAEVIIAEQDSKRMEELSGDGFHVMELDAEDETALVQAGVQNADVVVVSIGQNLQGSIITTLALKDLGVKKIVARAVDDKHAKVLEKVGADIVILPTRDMANRLAERAFTDWKKLVTIFSQPPLQSFKVWLFSKTRKTAIPKTTMIRVIQSVTFVCKSRLPRTIKFRRQKYQ
jgi:Trk K+ transport system NAD-binding subunit